MDDTNEEQARQRERQELNHALRNFAEHFGAAEVYQQARAIFLETPAGRAEREEQAAASFEGVLRDASLPIGERQKRAASGRRPAKASPSVEAARKALGG